MIPGTAAAGTVLPVLLHPEVLPVLPSQVLPLPLLGSEFSRHLTELPLFFVETVSLGPLLVPSRVALLSHYRPKASYGSRALSESSCHPNWTQRVLVETAAAGKVSSVLLQPERVPPVQLHPEVLPVLPSQSLSKPSLGSGGHLFVPG